MTTVTMYKEIELDTEIMQASPHRLIQLLFEKCLQQIQLASQLHEAKEISSRNQCIMKANDIVVYLQSCLNLQDTKTNELATLLDSNYVIVEKCLLNALLKTNDTFYLDLAAKMITTIKSGWDQIG